MECDDLETVVKVIVVGNGGVGKSSLTARYCKGTFTNTYKKTIGVGLGPSVRPVAPEVPAGRDPLKYVHLPSSSPYSSRPPEWLNPVRGLFLDKETATRHAAIRAKGWKLVAIPQPFWEVAARRRHQHYARRDLLLSLVMPLAPFEARPVSLQTRSRKPLDSSFTNKGSISDRKQSASSTTAELNTAKRLSSQGRSRKARTEARREVNSISERQN